MSTAVEIVSAFKQLPPREQEELMEQLERIWEDRLELSDEFKAKLERANRDLSAGNVRVRQPEA
jgi:hypothetical protein